MFISMSHVSKAYKNQIALNDINLELDRGKIIGLLGPNGSGKTTLIKILLGLLRQYSGKVTINDAPINDSTKAFISYLPDRNHIPLDWNFEYAMKFFSDFFADFSSTKAMHLAQNLDINPKLKIKSLSKGTQEKISLILMLSREAQLYIFDEPIAGVDPVARDRVFRLILDNYNQQATIIIATHLIYEVEKILNEVIFLDRGQIRLHKKLEEIITPTQNLEEIYKETFKCLNY